MVGLHLAEQGIAEKWEAHLQLQWGTKVILL